MKCFDLLADQTPAEVAVLDSYCIGGFWESATMTGKNLLAYSELQDSSMGGE